MLKRLKCPNCYSQARQKKIEDGLVACGKCSSTYYENLEEIKVKKSEESGGLFSDISDDEESYFSDNYKPSDNEESEDMGEFLTKTTDDLFTDSDFEPEKSPKHKDIFDDIDTSDSEKEEEQPKKKTKVMKMPAIFSDDLTPTGQRKVVKKKNQDELFSDIENDDEDLNKSKSMKRRYSDLDSSDDEEEPIKLFSKTVDKEMIPKSRVEKVSSRPSSRFNPFIVFNKLTRKKLAEDNPYLTNIELSKLVSKAWRSMEETQKEKFIQEQKEKREEICGIQRKLKKKRPTGNGFILFSAEVLPKVKAEYKDIKSINDLSSIVGLRWKGLSEEQRDVYKQQAKKEKEEWVRDNPEEYKVYLDKMIKKIRITKASKQK